MHVLTIPGSTSETIWLADPTGRLATIVIDALMPYVRDHAERRFSSALGNRYDLRPPAWVLDDWHRAMWTTRPRLAMDALTIVVAARVPPRDLVVGPARVIALVFDPNRALEDDRPIDQWQALDLDGVDEDVSRGSDPQPHSVIAIDTPDVLLELLAGALGIGPKRAERALAAATGRWPRFRVRKSAPDPLDAQLYARATAARSLDAS